MTIFVIRHGETPGNAARVVQTPDTPLSETGLQQAKLLGRRFADVDLGGILASDLMRAAMTAEQLSGANGAPVTFDSVLHERNFGDFRGRAYADLEVDLFGADFEPPGGEDWATFHVRVGRAWARIREVAAETRGDLAVVTHGLVCHSLVHNHLRLAPSDPPTVVPLRFENTAVTVVDATPPWTVRRLNCVAHLAGETPAREEGAPV